LLAVDVAATVIPLCSTSPIDTPPFEFPVIHVTPPSPDAISNWSSPVAEGASISPPIITLFEPVVIFLPPKSPTMIFLSPVVNAPAA
jgi:hypothetical protein